jgi:hypothetical protein
MEQKHFHVADLNSQLTHPPVQLFPSSEFPSFKNALNIRLNSIPMQPPQPRLCMADMVRLVIYV